MIQDVKTGQFLPNPPPPHKSGDRYGLLMLTGKSYMDVCGGQSRRFVESICDCGAIVYTLWQSLKSEAVKSCGCKKKAQLISMQTTHGLWKENKAMYSAWQQMNNRCEDENNISFHNYGGRGISVCKEWQSFENFYKWAIENGWREGLTVDRIDNEGIYEPSNCRIATHYVQSRNKRNNRNVTAFGETKCFKDWTIDPRCNVSYGGLHNRLVKLKWPPELAITTPPQTKNR